jgi:hypothetical protein
VVVERQFVGIEILLLEKEMHLLFNDLLHRFGQDLTNLSTIEWVTDWG